MPLETDRGMRGISFKLLTFDPTSGDISTIVHIRKVPPVLSGLDYHSG